jgi:hypothetical protein
MDTATIVYIICTPTTFITQMTSDIMEGHYPGPGTHAISLSLVTQRVSGNAKEDLKEKTP